MTTITENSTNRIEQVSVIASDSIFGILRDWLVLQQLKVQLRQERRGLRAMSDRMLRDIGLTREQALTEARSRNIPAARR